MNTSLEEKIIKFIKKNILTKEESLELIEDLYWADWDFLDSEHSDHIPRIFSYLKDNNLSHEEVSQILKLYNNPHGAYIDEFSDIIVDLYKRDRAGFIKSLNKEKDEAINLVYIFRNKDIKIDEDNELLELIKGEILSLEEKDTAEKFIKMYENICNT